MTEDEENSEILDYASDSSEAAFQENLKIMQKVLMRGPLEQQHYLRRKLQPNISSEWLKKVSNRLRKLDERVQRRANSRRESFQRKSSANWDLS